MTISRATRWLFPGLSATALAALLVLSSLSEEKKEDADERTLDGHIDLSPRGSQPWQPPYGTAGAVQNKATDASGAAAMTFTAAAGHACGMDFKAADHVKAHPEFMWQKDLQRDMRAYTWTSFTVAK